MNRPITRAAALAAAAILLAAMSACSTTAQPDYLLIRYDKGTGGGVKFKECVQPSRKAGMTGNDLNFAVPVSLLTWNIRPTGQGGDSDVPVQSGTLPRPATADATAQPGPEVKVYTKTEFYLNTDCGPADSNGISVDASSAVVRFWENSGRRYGVSVDGEEGFSDDGWRAMLLNTLVPATEKAVRSATRLYDADALDANTGGVWAKMERQMAQTFVGELTASIGGGDYFCGPQYRRDTKTGRALNVKWSETVPDPAVSGGFAPVEKEGTCPPVRISIIDVNFADQRVADSRAAAYAAEQQARADDIAADSKVNVANKLKAAGEQGAEVQRQQSALQLEQERTRQVAACAAGGAQCTVVTGAATGVNVGGK